MVPCRSQAGSHGFGSMYNPDCVGSDPSVVKKPVVVIKRGLRSRGVRACCIAVMRAISRYNYVGITSDIDRQPRHKKRIACEVAGDGCSVTEVQFRLAGDGIFPIRRPGGFAGDPHWGTEGRAIGTHRSGARESRGSAPGLGTQDACGPGVRLPAAARCWISKRYHWE